MNTTCETLEQPTLVVRPELVPAAGTPEAFFVSQVAARAREICGFYLAHRNAAVFVEGHDERWLFRYITFHLLSGNILVVRAGRTIAGVAFAWPDRAAAILARAERGEPQFNWRPFNEPGDAVFIGPMMGTRACGYGWRKLALERWPDLAARRVFAERKGKLMEYPARWVKWFCRRVNL